MIMDLICLWVCLIKADNRSNAIPGFFRVVSVFFKIVLVVIWLMSLWIVFLWILKFCRSNSVLVKSLVLINLLYNTFFCFMDWSMPLVNQGLDRFFFSLWLNLRGACKSSSFVILSRNFLYDKSLTIRKQSVPVYFFKFVWKISFLELEQ